MTNKIKNQREPKARKIKKPINKTVDIRKVEKVEEVEKVKESTKVVEVDENKYYGYNELSELYAICGAKGLIKLPEISKNFGEIVVSNNDVEKWTWYLNNMKLKIMKCEKIEENRTFITYTNE